MDEALAAIRSKLGCGEPGTLKFGRLTVRTARHPAAGAGTPQLVHFHGENTAVHSTMTIARVGAEGLRRGRWVGQCDRGDIPGR